MLNQNNLHYIDENSVSPQDFFEADTQKLFPQATHFSLSPADESGWEKVKYWIKRDKIYTRLGGGEGYVYILECRNQPGILKIGMTERTPNERVREINAGTGVIVPWMLIAAYPCKSPGAIERVVHLELSKYKVNKEGFNVTPKMAKEAVERAITSNHADL